MFKNNLNKYHLLRLLGLLLLLFALVSNPLFTLLYGSSLNKQYIVGYSVQHRPIKVIELGEGNNVTLIFGAFHGDEPQSKYVVEKLYNYLISHNEILKGRKVILVPAVNPDGLAKNTRVNANGVDINRNFPTEDWTPKPTKKRSPPGEKPASEPETRIVISIIEKYNPSKIISIHSPLHCINYDGPGKELAYEMAKYNKYPVKSYIGYPTRGSFGTYGGKERGIPTITLELPNISGEKAWLQNKDALISAIEFDVNKIKKSINNYSIKIVKSKNVLYLYKNGGLLKTYSVSTGFNKLPYNGNFRIISKERINCWKFINNQWVSYCKNKTLEELGPYFLAINSRHRKTKRRLGIHGTHQEHLIGKSVSKGCVRMRNKDIEELYKIIPIGTPVEVIN